MVDELLAVMAALRAPGSGCPWDLEQTFETIAAYAIEEAYEVADAIERRDTDDLREELGDLLLQVVFHAQIAKERGLFEFADVAAAITAKLIRRHPHVFGDRRGLDAAQVKVLWAEIKREEARRKPGGPESALDGVPVALPALTRAEKLSRKAAEVGFDWRDAAEVVAKIREEADEVEHALAAGTNRDLEEEVGDLLFAVANLARHAGLDAEAALRGANAKFVRRFRHMETALARTGRGVAGTGIAALEELWSAAKRSERTSPGSEG